MCERSPQPLQGQGAGIILNPATVRWLTAHDPPAATAIGLPLHVVRYLEPGGAVAAEVEVAYRVVSYDVLYRTLLRAFGRERYMPTEEVVGAARSRPRMSSARRATA